MADVSLPSGPVMTELGKKKTHPVLKMQLPSGILVTIPELDVKKPSCDR